MKSNNEIDYREGSQEASKLKSQTNIQILVKMHRKHDYQEIVNIYLMFTLKFF